MIGLFEDASGIELHSVWFAPRCRTTTSSTRTFPTTPATSERRNGRRPQRSSKHADSLCRTWGRTRHPTRLATTQLTAASH